MEYTEDEIADLKRVKANLGPWKKIFKTVINHKWYTFGLIMAVILVTILNVIYPLLNQYAIEHYFEGVDPNRFDNLPIFVTIYISVAVANGLIIFLYIFIANRIDIAVSYDLRKEAYKKLQELPFSYFDTTSQGWIIARLTSDATKLSEIISWGAIELLEGVVTMIAVLSILLYLNTLLGLIVLVLLPIVFIISNVLRKKILKAYREARAHNSVLTAAFNEGYMGAKASKSLVIEDKNMDEFVEKARKYKSSSIRALLFSSLLGPIVFIICYFAVGTTLYFGATIGVTISILYVFVDYTIRFFDPVINVSAIIGDFQQAQASAERIISLIDEIPDIRDTDEVIEKYGTVYEPKYENFEPLIGDVEFKNVSFKYKVGEEVLSNFNLKIKPGSSVALVGHTGSGKSTIVNLICRFYEPTKGEILIDGKNYKERSITWLHSNLGYVLQTPQLFSGSILDNVRYGKLDATDEECINALKTVSADGFIEKLEDGYNSLVGEGGNKLSIGEKQLISFARAIVANPRILILDEATSSIDTKTEHLIQNAIEIASKDRTTFMIAHRLSTVVNADLIIVMKDGKIVEQGTHHELLMNKGYYFELYRNQFTEDKINSLLK